MNKREELLSKISNDKPLSSEELMGIDYINLHAHSTYSLQDAVGPVADHFIETIKKGHCGCAITDHGSYASFADLDYLRENKAENKKVDKLFKAKGIKKHDVVMGSELYIIDDRHVPVLIALAKVGDKFEILNVLKKMKENPKWSALFFDKKENSAVSINDDELKSESDSNLIGDKLITAILKLSESDLIARVEEFCTSSLKTKSYKYNHITVLAKSYEGHQNLCHLTSIGSLPENFYTRPRITLSQLFENKAGLIITTGCFIGMIPHAIHKKTGEEEELVGLFLKEFGDDFYIEMHVSDIRMVWNPQLKKHVDQGWNPQKLVNDRLLELAKNFGILHKVYITQDSHLPKKEDKEIQDILILNDDRNKSGWHFYNNYFIMSVEEMYHAVREYYPEYSNVDFINWCFNSIEVLNKCKNVEINTDFKLKIPDYKNHHSVLPIKASQKFVKSKNLSPVDEILLEEKIESSFDSIESALSSPEVDRELTLEMIEKHKKVDLQIAEIFEDQDYFVQKAKRFYEKGDKGTIGLLRTALLLNRFDYKNPELKARYFSELNTIQFNGMLPLSDYFFHFETFSYVVRKAVEYKTPGRGSAAGCYLAYTLDVTNVRPDKYQLLMERFLQRERIGVFFWKHSKLAKEIQNEGSYASFNEIERLTKDKVDPQFKKNYDEEIYNLECNPGICDYVLELKGIAGDSPLPNENNSYICYLLGACEKPSKRMKKTAPSMPDIDYDSSCRDIICEYLLKKHGKDHFAYICNYGSMKVKSSIKDVLRIRTLINGKKLTPDEVNLITAEVDKVKLSEEEKARLMEDDEFDGEISIFNYMLENNTELSKFFSENENIKDEVEKFLGTYKTIGIHAAGVILSDQPITRYSPCVWDVKKGAYKTQLAKDQVERIGLVKMDLLGLVACEIVRECAKQILVNHGVDYLAEGKIEAVLDNLPDEVARALSRADTIGIFQANTPTSMSLLKRVRKIKDPVRQWAVFTSLLRPGPMGSKMHTIFVDILNGDIEESYLDPALQDILKETFGTLVYQEQVMKICQVIGGFSAFESDSIRKAMGKKKITILDKYKGQFVNYAVNSKHLKKDIAEEIWNQMAKFAEYGFNKSHAISYSAVTCISLYFYKKYPLEWITALLSIASKAESDKGKRDYKLFYKTWKDKIRSPSLSKSQSDYAIKNGLIYMPLHVIKGVGLEVATDIIGLQPFSSFKDFVIKGRSIGRMSKKVVEGVVFSGSADEFMPSKTKMKNKFIEGSLADSMSDIETLCDYAKVILGKEFSFPSISLVEERIKSGIRVSPEETHEAVQEILNSGLFEVPMTPINFRKYLYFKYVTEYDFINIKKPLKVALEEENILTPENIIIALTKGSGALIAKYPKLATKLCDKKGQIKESSLIALNGTDGAIGKMEEAAKEIMTLNPKIMVLRQLEYLKFTTFDFSATFKEEITKISAETSVTVLELKVIEELGNKILHKAEWHNHTLSRLVKTPLVNDSMADVLIRERYIADIFERGKALFGWRFNRGAMALVNRDTTSKDPKTMFSHLFYRVFLGQFLKGLNTDEKTFALGISEILTNEEKDALQVIMGTSLNIQEINVLKKIPMTIAQIINALMYKTVLQKLPICESFHKNKKLLTIGKDIERRLGDRKSGMTSLYTKLKLSEDMTKLLYEGIDLICNGVNDTFKDKIAEFRSEMDANSLDEKEKILTEKGTYIFGTVFRLEKKKFLRDVGRGDYAKRIMTVTLNDENESVNLVVEKVDKETVTREVDGAMKQLPMHEEFKDFTPVVVKARIEINLNDLSLELKYVPGSSSVIFILDSLC